MELVSLIRKVTRGIWTFQPYGEKHIIRNYPISLKNNLQLFVAIRMLAEVGAEAGGGQRLDTHSKKIVGPQDPLEMVPVGLATHFLISCWPLSFQERATWFSKSLPPNGRNGFAKHIPKAVQETA